MEMLPPNFFLLPKISNYVASWHALAGKKRKKWHVPHQQQTSSWCSCTVHCYHPRYRTSQLCHCFLYPDIRQLFGWLFGLAPTTCWSAWREPEERALSTTMLWEHPAVAFPVLSCNQVWTSPDQWIFCSFTVWGMPGFEEDAHQSSSTAHFHRSLWGHPHLEPFQKWSVSKGQQLLCSVACKPAENDTNVAKPLQL